MGLNNNNIQYQDFLAAMSDEDKAKYLEDKANKRMLKKLTQAKLEDKADEMSDLIVALAERILKDPESSSSDLAVIYDRLVGKPQQEIDVTSGGKSLPSITIVPMDVSKDDS